MLDEGEIEEKGVQAPENCIEPDRFFAELSMRDMKVCEGAEFEYVID